MPVADIEAFNLLAAVVDDDSAIGQNSIHVKQEESNALGFFTDRGWNALHG